MVILLQAINYSKHQWHICGELKIIGLLLGLQGGFTKYCCFLCLWDSRATKDHFTKREWPPRESFQPGQSNVKHVPLVDPKNVYLPPLHIKLGLMKQFVIALYKDSGLSVTYVSSLHKSVMLNFAKASLLGHKSASYVWFWIRHNHDWKWGECMEKFQLLCTDFLGNHKASNFSDLVENFLTNYRSLECRVSLKVHFLHAHLDFFASHLG